MAGKRLISLAVSPSAKASRVARSCPCSSGYLPFRRSSLQTRKTTDPKDVPSMACHMRPSHLSLEERLIPGEKL